MPQIYTPILVIWDSQTSARLSGYITEIFHVEGYNWYTVHDLASASLTADQLARFPIAMLAHVDISAETESVLLNYVDQGGALIAMRPPESLASALGLHPFNRDIADRYIALNKLCALNDGVDLPPLQFHGRAELYLWHGEPAHVLAYFAASPEFVTKHPAITVGTRGQGAWAVFAYDLAESTVLLHQGLADQASTGSNPDPDGDRSFKPNDLFVGYLDPALCYLPQADLQQDMLVRVLEWTAELAQPLPRLWYFPEAAHAVAFINGDGDSMALSDLVQTIATADRFQVPYTTYLKMDDHPKVEPAFETALRQQGHDFGQHAFAGLTPSLDEMRNTLRAEMDAFRTRYGHESVTYRGHSVIWVGWTEMAKYLRENEVRLDTNFAAARYHHAGYVNGSGLPVKFMDEDGRLIDLYEQTTMSTDDGWTTDKIFANPLSVEGCIALSKEQADAAIDQFHTVYHPYFHPLRTRAGPTSSQLWLEAVLAHCRERQFHFVSGVDWVEFNDGRREAAIIAYEFQPNTGALRFTLEAAAAVHALSLVLPYAYRGAAMESATVNGEAVPIEPCSLEDRMQVLLTSDYSAGQQYEWHIQWRVTG
jgi:hypothetical protein